MKAATPLQWNAGKVPVADLIQTWELVALGTASSLRLAAHRDVLGTPLPLPVRLADWGRCLRPSVLFKTYKVLIYDYLDSCCFAACLHPKATELQLRPTYISPRSRQSTLPDSRSIQIHLSDFRPRDTMKSQFNTPHSELEMTSSNKKWLPSRPSFNTKAKSKPNTNSSSLLRSSTEPTGSASKPSKSAKAWQKTKEFFNSLGEPPTAAYEREQVAKKQVKTSGREAFGAVNYGPYQQGGPFGGRT